MPPAATAKVPEALRTISEVADMLELPGHVLRFWETKFPQIQPMKRAGGRRFYRPQDIEVLEIIRDLLHKQGFTIKGAQKELPARVRQSRHEDVAADSVEIQQEIISQDGILKDSLLRSKLTRLRDELVAMQQVLAG